MPATIEPDTYLSDLNASVYIELAQILDIGATWKKLMGVMPEGLYKAGDVFKFEQKSPNVGSGGPSSSLLLDMGVRGVTVRGLIMFLEKIELERALILIKEFDPVRIVEPLPARIVKQAGPGTRLRLECFATGFPRPTFQWFKYSCPDGDWLELRDQHQSVLDIEPVKKQDGGLYSCRAYNENPRDDKKSVVFTDTCCVEINLAIQASESETKISNQYKKPEIIEHPTLPNRRPLWMGSSIVLICRADGQAPLNYKWFKNGVVIEGANDCKIVLEDLQPVNDESKFEVQCAVSNSFGMALSKVASFSLAPPVEFAQFTAEDKVALLIGNEAYQDHPALNCSSMDVSTLAQSLRKMNFKVFCLVNLTRDEMSAIVDTFCKFLRSGVYGLFYYAGHSFQLSGQSYMLPVDAKKDYSLGDCLCLEDVLERMQRHSLELCFIIFDACRREHHQDYFNEQPVTYVPRCNRNSVRFYSTTSFFGALDGTDGKNGIFMRHLKNFICAKKLLEEVLQLTKADISVDPCVSKKQFPEYTSNLAKGLSLWDNVRAPSPLSSEMTGMYECITKKLEGFELDVSELDVQVVIEFPPCEFLNALDLKLSVRTSTFCKETWIAIVERFEASEPCSVKWDMAYEQQNDIKCVTVNVFDLQKTKTPLVMIVKLCCDGQKSKCWKIDLPYPWGDQIQIWDHIRTRSPEESGFVSDLNDTRSSNSAIKLDNKEP